MPNVITGTSKDDVLNGTSNEDVIYGLAGNDRIDGGNGNDIISGGGKDSAFDASSLVINADAAGTVTIENPAKGSLNPVGMYKIDAAGNITDVRILFDGNTSGSKGSGNAPTLTMAALSLKAGERYGFFILSNGYGTGGNNKLLTTAATAKWELRDEAGGTGDIADKGLRLWHVEPATGKKTLISSSNGHEIYHSVNGGGFTPNPDGAGHARTTVDYALGIVTIGLESGKGGNPDFADAIIRFNIGRDNALNLGEPDPNGNGGDDTLNGGEGNDVVLGMMGNDVVSGGNGQDRLYGNTGNDKVYGDGGDDYATGGSGNDSVYGGEGQDRLLGNTGADLVDGGAGDDTINGNDGDDALFGGLGNDTISGGKGVDAIDGGDGNDTIKGDTGIDTIHGGAGNDNIKGGDGDDTLDGGTGDDWVSGGKGIDRIADSEGNDTIKGDSGNDTVIAGLGNDSYDGGSGVDTIDFSAFMGVTVDLKAKTATGAGNDKVESFENVIGSKGHDKVTGDSNANVIQGGDGNDTIAGGRGADTLTGGAGADIFVWMSKNDITGETGNDRFLDHITDFGTGDVLDFRFLPGDQTSVSLRVEAGATILSSVLVSGGPVIDIVALDAVTGLTVAQLYASGALLV